VRNIYSDLPKNLNKIFEPREQIKVKDLKEINLEQLLPEIYSSTTIYVDKQDTEGKATANSFTLLPKGVNSLKVLQELPIILVLMYQIYKQNVHQEIVDFVPLIMSTITLQPSPVHRAMPTFNREIFVDFMSAQIKALSFLAYIVRTFLSQFQDIINSHSTQMVEGMISLLRLCPQEVASTRKELLVATRHILATDLRNKFINSIDLLFDEDLLLGRGYTSFESLRPLAYSTLADLIHHVRQHLKLDILTKAVYLFSKNVHDESLPTSIQTMSCKLLLNLVDCIRVQRNDDSFPSPTPRELLLTMLKVFTLKFHTIAKLQLPLIMQKWKNITAQMQTTTVDINKEMVGIDITPESVNKLTTIGFSAQNTLNVCEYRSLVKTLICGVKTITFGVNLTENSQPKMPVTFQPDEVLVFIDLFKWALEALDIYMINMPTPGMQVTQKNLSQMPRSKDEKELLEHFSGLFLTMSPQNFQEIFSSTIDFMVDRISQNVALQVIANSFLASPTTSPLFATVLIEYLLERMEEMGSNIERSNLYLRLFKLVFGSVSLFANENEQMLRPHLHAIVNRSMDLAMTAKEPYNYFLLLRALFRSIGGGSHDKLYKEFLPLLPNLLEGLNRLQSGYHKQHMKDLFVELCLTVPVRLSSLLPYLPMLMDPLVSALNGSPTLVNQGLRTLELCVDNLQPDFLYDHIQPVRAELMQALWKTLRNQDTAALVAFRVLGKFGGGNRKMMIEPQRLEYANNSNKESNPPSIVANFQEQRKPIDFPVDAVIETAFNALKTSSTDPFYWAQSWEVIRCYLAASISLVDEKHILQKLFTHPSFTEGPIPNINITQSHFQENQARKTHQIALTAMFVAAATKELRQNVIPVFVDVVRHYTMVAIAQQGILII
jgi:transformation/transcription domain-associated protein